jgi:hypothetical protein
MNLPHKTALHEISLNLSTPNMGEREKSWRKFAAGMENFIMGLRKPCEYAVPCKFCDTCKTNSEIESFLAK